MWPKSRFPTDLVAFTEKILNGKLHFFVQCVKSLNKQLVRQLVHSISISKEVSSVLPMEHDNKMSRRLKILCALDQNIDF